MHFSRLSVAALQLLTASLVVAVPVHDSPRQRLLNGLPLPRKYDRHDGSPAPYTPEHRDPYDHAVDAVGDDLDPLPWRNGQGASVLGPWNKERARQSPDLVRPPSTDHGDVPNLRWSFVDSHIRIEVSRTYLNWQLHSCTTRRIGQPDIVPLLGERCLSLT